MQIHPTAIIEDGARLSEGCVIHAHAYISRYCQLDEGVVVHPFAVIGGDPQDLSFDARIASGLRIGARTVLREHVTVNRATRTDACTQIGSDCFLMASSHVAHDCQIGNHVVIANAVLLAGHVQIADRAFLGGGAVVHQFCRIGESAMIGGGARISGDVPPFCMATERNALVGLNLVGLRRRGFERQVVAEIKRAYRALNQPIGNPRDQAALLLQQEQLTSREARQFVEFFEGSRRRHIVRAHKHSTHPPLDD